MTTLAGRRELARYSRHLLIPEVGLAGQERLARARVLVVGAGGLGSPVLAYLAAAGVGRIGIVDDDAVDITNLQRQILYETADIGKPKAATAAERLHALNPQIALDVIATRFDASNARERSSRTVAAAMPLQHSFTVCFPQKSSGPIDCAKIIVRFPARTPVRTTPA